MTRTDAASPPNDPSAMIQLAEMPDLGSLPRQLRDGLALLTVRERRFAALLCGSMIVNALLQMFALVGIVPFVQALIDTEKLIESRFGQVIVGVFPDISQQQIMALCGGGLLILVLVKNAYHWVHLGWQNHFTARCEMRLSREMLERMLAAPYVWVTQQNSIFLRETIFSYSMTWSRQFVRTLLILVNDVVLMLTIFAVLIAASPTVGIAVVVGACLLGAVIFRVTRRVLTSLAHIKRLATLRASRTCLDTILGIKDVKMTGSEELFTDEYARYVEAASLSEARSGQWSQFPRLGVEIVGFGTILTISTVAVSAGSEVGEIAGLIALYALAAVRILPLLTTLLTNVTSVFKSLPMVRVIIEMREATETRDPDAGAEMPDAWRVMALQNVSFAYVDSDRPAVRDIDLRVERGRVYGVVGRSGAGKSTLVDLISGLLPPTSGQLTLDGKELDRAEILGWRRRISYVAQMPFLLDSSLAKNVAFAGAEGEIDMQRLERAIFVAQLTDVVQSLRDGVHTRVGEQGVMISGGQRQRVAIARAIYRDAELLVLDEATSSLDSLSEQEFTNEVKALSGKLTIIIIAHRLSTVRHCDEIWVMEDGRLVSRGSHDALRRSSETYRRLLEAQAGERESSAMSAHEQG